MLNMRKNNLSNKGLSMSQAQSISNLCHQRAMEISNTLGMVNNCSKTVNVEGKKVTTVVGVPLPEDTIELLETRAKLHACQAFLMENIKAKESLLASIKSSSADLSEVEQYTYEDEMNPVRINVVTEEFGWESLSKEELNEAVEAEAYAAHIGLFIHKDSKLAKLRNELTLLPAVEWMNIKKDEQTPVIITPHHKREQLIELHEKLAEKHRAYEQKINYFKAKVKNLTTLENARIAQLNANAQIEAEKYNNAIEARRTEFVAKQREEIKTLKTVFEIDRQNATKKAAALKIEIDPRFQDVIDAFLAKLPKSED